jgi:hypothetical protein
MLNFLCEGRFEIEYVAGGGKTLVTPMLTSGVIVLVADIR